MGQIAGAAIGAAGDIVATGMQTAASITNTNNTNKTNIAIADKTNQTNKEIAQMNNEYNEAQLEKQIQQEWDMWNAENEYNSPAAQMQRYKDAGINPYMASGNVSSGNASSMSSPSPQPASPYTAVGATVQPTDFSSLSGLRGIARNFVDLMSAQEGIKGQQLENQSKEIENDYKANMFMVEMYKKLSDAKLSNSKAAAQKIENMFKPELLSSELKQRQTDMTFRTLQSQGQLISNLSAMEWYKVLPTQIQQAVSQKAVEINNLKLMGRLTSAQVRTEVNKAVTEFYKSRSAHDDAAVSNGTIQARIDKIKADLTHAINNSGPDGYLGLPNILYHGIGEVGKAVSDLF